MLTALKRALVTDFNATGTLTSAFTGGINHMPARDGVALPFLGYAIIDAVPTYSMGGLSRRIEDVRIQFSIFTESTSVETADALLEALRAHFDDHLLTVSGFNNFKFERVLVVPFFDEDVNGHGYHVDYMVSM